MTLEERFNQWRDKAEAALHKSLEKYPLAYQAMFSPKLTDDKPVIRTIPEHICSYQDVDTIIGRQRSEFCCICGKEDLTDRTPEIFKRLKLT
jgi:hypothetical protein